MAHNTHHLSLDRDFKPVVAWPGEGWNEGDVVADIIEVSEFSKNADSVDDEGFLPDSRYL